MAKTSRLAGTANFPAARFRQAIRGVWEMAATPDAQPLTFGFNEVASVVTGSLDGEGVPFDPAAHVTRIVPPPVVVPCGVEYVRGTDEATPLGVVTQPRLRITLFDEDYAKVKDAAWVEQDGERYLYAYDEPPTGLFTVGLHVLVFRHEGER